MTLNKLNKIFLFNLRQGISFVVPKGSVVFDSESNFKISQKNFATKISRRLLVSQEFQIAISRHQMALDSHKYHHSTQNQKLHRPFILRFFSQEIDLLTFSIFFKGSLLF